MTLNEVHQTGKGESAWPRATWTVWESRGVYTTEQKRYGSDKNWSGSNSFCKETVNFCRVHKARLHDRKIGYGPDKKRIRILYFCPCKLCGSCLLAWLRTRAFFGSGAIVAWRGGYTTEKKWYGSDKNWNGSNSFCKETVNFYPFRNGSIGAYSPVYTTTF